MSDDVVALSPGFYDDGAGVRRWWDGRGWTEHTEQVALEPAARTAALNAAVSNYARAGYAVEMNDGVQAVVARVKRMGWFWNTVLVIVTGGLWLIYVIYRALNRKVDRRVITVDELGRVKYR